MLTNGGTIVIQKGIIQVELIQKINVVGLYIFWYNLSGFVMRTRRFSPMAAKLYKLHPTHRNNTPAAKEHIQGAIGQPFGLSKATAFHGMINEVKKSAQLKFTTNVLVGFRNLRDNSTARMTRLLPQVPTTEATINTEATIARSV